MPDVAVLSYKGSEGWTSATSRYEIWRSLVNMYSLIGTDSSSQSLCMPMHDVVVVSGRIVFHLAHRRCAIGISLSSVAVKFGCTIGSVVWEAAQLVSLCSETTMTSCIADCTILIINAHLKRWGRHAWWCCVVLYGDWRLNKCNIQVWDLEITLSTCTHDRNWQQQP